MFAWALLVVSLGNTDKGILATTVERLQECGLQGHVATSALESCHALKAYHAEGVAQEESLLAALKRNASLCEKIRSCLQGSLQRKHTHLRGKFRQLSPEQKATSALLGINRLHVIATHVVK